MAKTATIKAAKKTSKKKTVKKELVKNARRTTKTKSSSKKATKARATKARATKTVRKPTKVKVKVESRATKKTKSRQPRKTTAKRVTRKTTAKTKTKTKAKVKNSIKKQVAKKVAKKKVPSTKKEYVKKSIEESILTEYKKKENSSEKKKRIKTIRTEIEQIVFKIPYVEDPLIGTPKEVREKLNKLAKRAKRNRSNNRIFNRIHLYMHGHLINIVVKKFPFIHGMTTADTYQEALIVLKFKAIEDFDETKGMSFLNFAKMCIRKRLITLLHSSRHTNKHKPINQAISLDSPIKDNDSSDTGERNTLSNVIQDPEMTAGDILDKNESYQVTLDALSEILSRFECVVLDEYLKSGSYKDISRNVSQRLSKGYTAKSVDNALLRIRKKAQELKRKTKVEKIPLFNV